MLGGNLGSLLYGDVSVMFFIDFAKDNVTDAFINFLTEKKNLDRLDNNPEAWNSLVGEFKESQKG